MNNQRRIFRGRGGPTDRRLPKHNARRRRKHPVSHDVVSDDPNPVPRPVEPDSESESYTSLPEEEFMQVEEEDIEAQDDGAIVQANPVSPQPNTSVEPWRQEISHLTKRIRNVQESIQLGSEGIANPATYKANVLNAVENCVNEWRAIMNHYNGEGGVGEATIIDAEIIKETSLKIFVLLQLALQCGPLAGGKPGYFKRCGGAVARMVLEFLEKAVPNESEGLTLGFSTKQTDAIAIWKVNASKAALEDKPPSKSALKKQQGKSKKKKNKK